MPTWRAWALVKLAHWLPGVLDLIMIRLGPSSYKDAQAHAEAAAAGDGASTS